MSGISLSTGLTSTSSSTLFATPEPQNGTARNNTVDMAARNIAANADPGSRGPRLAPSTDFGPQLNFTVWLLTALSAAFLALRVYCKFLRHRGLWWDDYLLIASWLSLVADCAFISACINLGFGRPLTQFNPHNLAPFLLYSNLAGSFSILAALWSKTSFAATVLRISSGWLRALVWFIIVTVNACLGVAIAITWAQCTPIEKVWRPGVPGECWPKGVQVKYNIFTAIYSGAMDIVLAVVPWRIIWSMTMNRKEKIGVMVAMSMGVFAGITSIIKITQLPSISNATFTESTTQLVILAAAESAITIIASSIPILRALIRDSRPPPDPAQFYHSLDFSVYTGARGELGTGSSSVVISSAGRQSWSGSRSRSRHSRSQSQSRLTVHSRGFSRSSSTVSRGHSRGSSSLSTAEWWDKELQPHSRSHSRSTSSSAIRLPQLSRFSGLSMMVLGGRRSADRGGWHGQSASSTTNMSTVSGMGSMTVEVPLPTPPPGRIVTTEEVVVEYEERGRWGQGQDHWPGVGHPV